MKYSVKIPLLVSLYFGLTALYTFVQCDSMWMDVLWACYKNFSLMACLVFMFSGGRVIWADKLFIGVMLINLAIQSGMYIVCPFASKEVRIVFFNYYGWFTVLCGVSALTYYLHELFTGERS